jgi:hypothetical protein
VPSGLVALIASSVIGGLNLASFGGEKTQSRLPLFLAVEDPKYFSLSGTLENLLSATKITSVILASLNSRRDFGFHVHETMLLCK